MSLAVFDEAFVDNMAAQQSLVCGLKSGGIHSTRYYRVAVTGTKFYRATCMIFDGDAASRDGKSSDEVFSEVMALLTASPSGFTFTTTPFTTPRDLGDRLVRDFNVDYIHDLHVLAAEVATIGARPAASLPDGYEIREVLSIPDFNAYMKVFCESFGYDGEQVELMRSHFEANVGMKQYPALRRFIAWSGDTAVAVSSSWTYAGVNGVYSVATLPAHRGRGIGSAMARHAALSGAPLSGVAVLQATEKSAALYRNLGFEDCGKYSVYRSQRLDI